MHISGVHTERTPLPPVNLRVTGEQALPRLAVRHSATFRHPIGAPFRGKRPYISPLLFGGK